MDLLDSTHTDSHAAHEPVSDTARSAKDATRRAAVDLVVSGSLEIGAHRPEDAAAVAELLPAGTPVFVNHLPRHSLDDTLRGLMAVRAAGLEPVPHMAARRIATEADARTFVQRAVREAGVKKVLVIGGDTPEAGAFADAATLIRSRILVDNGIREVGLASYPESHPRIPKATLNAAFAEKMDLLQRQQLGAFAITQFTFAPQRTIELCAALARRYPHLPVYAGLPGPTSLPKLVKYAQRCGVGASLRALQTLGRGTLGLFANSDPSDQLERIAHHAITGTMPNVVGIHMFTFGGVDTTAQFMNRWITR